MQVLKPCPFCGNPPERVFQARVVCKTSGCPLFRTAFDSEGWNTRAPDPHAERLAEALKDLMAWGVEFDDSRLGYLSVQVGREALEAACAALREYEAAKRGEEDNHA